MNNHVMYFYDKHGELELTRCCLCKQMIITCGELMCKRGYDCNREECQCESIEKKDISERFRLLREKGARQKTELPCKFVRIEKTDAC